MTRTEVVARAAKAAGISKPKARKVIVALAKMAIKKHADDPALDAQTREASRLVVEWAKATLWNARNANP